MPRPSQVDEKRHELIPLVARAFADLGYRRTTTAELAKRCKVRENILYRLWPDKKAMFIAAIEYVYELSKRTWEKLVAGGTSASTAESLLEYEAKHIGEFGHARIIFAGLSETDDPDIRGALSQMYQRYQEFIVGQVHSHRKSKVIKRTADAELSAWAIIGLGTLASITRELNLLTEKTRRQLMTNVGQVLLG
jgi:AcrR family transcriptional regulator